MAPQDDAWVGPARRRKRLLLAALLLTGLALLGGFVALIDHYSAQSEALRAHGGRTQGVVTRVVPDRKGSEGAARVRYDVDGRDFEEVVDLGSDADHYEVGQTVTVYYDRANPRSMTIDNEDNQPTWTVTPMVLMLVVGGGSVIAALYGGQLWWRRRSLLALPWTTVSVRLETRGVGRSRRYVLTRRNGPPIRLYAPIGRVGDRLQVQLVEQGTLAVIGVPERGRLRAGRVLTKKAG